MSDKFDPFVAEWVSFSADPRYNLVEKCLKIAQVLEYPDLNMQEQIEKINKIAKSLKVLLSDVKNPTYFISMLNEYLFQTLGFKGDVDDYYDPKNNFLNEVLDKKSGIPITLSIIYVEVAKRIGIDLTITGFPSHVVVKYNEEMILDPFGGGRLLDMEDLNEILYQNFEEEIEFSPEFLDELPEDKILIRILRNLKSSYAQSYAYEKAMRCTNMILAVEPESPDEIRDKGILEERMLNYEKALIYLNKYLELAPEAPDVDFILEMIRNVRDKISL
ncbi:MAG: tetratricopeptide repeat protein [Candidatus Nitrosotenuis sp.]|nr:MAG: tetratricopeptide repeat protein [Candidatus Nitrosotenuis sp.]